MRKLRTEAFRGRGSLFSPRGFRGKLLLTALVILAVAGAGSAGTWAAFVARTTNTGNTVASGSVAIGDNDSGSSLLSLSSAQPGDSVTKCIRVSYTGSLSSTVRLYGTVSGSLASKLTLTVTRGTDSSPSAGTCNFTADSTNYTGNGAGVIYQGSLSAFPSSYASGIVDPTSGTPEAWTNPESHAYRFAVSLNNDNTAQGQSASAGFTWEARNQ